MLDNHDLVVAAMGPGVSWPDMQVLPSYGYYQCSVPGTWVQLSDCNTSFAYVPGGL